MDANLNDAIENVFKQWESMKLDDAVNQLREAYEAALEAESENGKEFEELFKEWCDSAEAQQLYDEPASMHDQMELFFALGRDRRVTPVVMTTNGMEEAVYTYPAETVKIYQLDWNGLDNAECPMCKKDADDDKPCPHCGFDPSFSNDQAWEWVKAREGVMSNGE